MQQMPLHGMPYVLRESSHQEDPPSRRTMKKATNGIQHASLLINNNIADDDDASSSSSSDDDEGLDDTGKSVLVLNMPPSRRCNDDNNDSSSSSDDSSSTRTGSLNKPINRALQKNNDSSDDDGGSDDNRRLPKGEVAVAALVGPASSSSIGTNDSDETTEESGSPSSEKTDVDEQVDDIVEEDEWSDDQEDEDYISTQSQQKRFKRIRTVVTASKVESIEASLEIDRLLNEVWTDCKTVSRPLDPQSTLKTAKAKLGSTNLLAFLKVHMCIYCHTKLGIFFDRDQKRKCAIASSVCVGCMTPQRQGTWTSEQACETLGNHGPLIMDHLQNDYTPITSSSDWLIGTSLYSSIAVTGAAVQAYGSIWDLYYALAQQKTHQSTRKKRSR